MVVSIPSSISFAVNLIFPVLASIKIHFKMGSVVLFDTALETIETACTKSDFVHMIFINVYNSFRCQIVVKINKLKVVVIVVVASGFGDNLKKPLSIKGYKG